MLRASVAVARQMCGTALRVPCASGTMDIASLRPRIALQALKLIFAFVLKARHICRAASSMTIRCILRLEEKIAHG
jgi:hypothetical protein